MLTFAYWSSDTISELWETWEFLSAVIELVLGDSKHHHLTLLLLWAPYTFRHSCWVVCRQYFPQRPSVLFSYPSAVPYSIFILSWPGSTPSKGIVLSLPSIPLFSIGYEPMYLSMSTLSSRSTLPHAVWLFPGASFQFLFGSWSCKSLWTTFFFFFMFLEKWGCAFIYLSAFLKLCRIPAHILNKIKDFMW